MSIHKKKAVDFVKKNSKLFLRELSKRYVQKEYKLRELASGSSGVLYQVSPHEVVKVMSYVKYQKEISFYKSIFVQFNKLYSRHPSLALHKHFYRHSTFEFSHVCSKDNKPLFIFERMPYLPMDLSEYSHSVKWTFTQFIDIVCQIIHGIHLFHRLHYILTDLKIQNILIHPRTGRVKLIDFGASYNKVLKNKSFYRTYYNRKVKNTTKEDVWRLGILIYDFLRPYVNSLRKKQNLPDVQKMSYMVKAPMDAIVTQAYDFKLMVESDLISMRDTLMNSVQNVKHKREWKQIFTMIRNMLHTDPDKRPSLCNVLAVPALCTHCVLPRVDFSDDFKTHSNKHSNKRSVKSTKKYKKKHLRHSHDTKNRKSK